MVERLQRQAEERARKLVRRYKMIQKLMSVSGPILEIGGFRFITYLGGSYFHKYITFLNSPNTWKEITLRISPKGDAIQVKFTIHPSHNKQRRDFKWNELPAFHDYLIGLLVDDPDLKGHD